MPRDGRGPVQLYLHDPVAQVTRPVRSLAGFASVEIGEYRLRSPFVPVNTQIAGTAIA